MPEPTTDLPATIVARAPKALLHDHLDGGLRPATVVELAEAVRLRRPAHDGCRGAGAGSATRADSGSLVRYLETFAHTVAVMQTRDALTRVARECALDLAADGVVYAEVALRARAAPRGRPRPDRGRRGGAGRVPRGRAGGGGRRHAHPDAHPAHGDAARGAQPRDRRAGRALPRRGRRRASTSPAPRPGSRPPGTSTRSSTSAGRTPTSPSTPARRSGCRASGRRSSGAAPTGSGTACASSTTSRPVTTAPRARWAVGLRARLPHPARDVPQLERPDRCRGLDRGAPDRAAQRAALPGDGQHRQPADERHVDEPRDAAARRRGRLDPATTCAGSRSTR